MSVKATPVSTAAFGLVIVKLRVVPPFNGIVAVPKDLLIEGGATTVTVFEPVLFVSLYLSTFHPPVFWVNRSSIRESASRGGRNSKRDAERTVYRHSNP